MSEIHLHRNVQPDPTTEPLKPTLIVFLAQRHGGVDVRVLQTARELHRRGASFFVAVLEGTSMHDALAREGLPVAPLRRRRTDPRIVLDLIRLIRRHGLALIDAHNMQSQYWSALAALLKASVRGRVATVHSIYREEDGGRLRRWFREGALRLCRVAGFKFVAVSTNVQRYLVETLSVPASKVVLSRNGMEDLTAPPLPFDLEAETGWTTDSVILSVIGRLEPVKGHRFLISALAGIVASGDTRLRLLIVGSGREEEKLRAQVSAFGLEPYVHFTGFRNDVTSILTRTDVLCVPSTSEGLPYVVLEAARQSVPVLASELEGTAAVFAHGETIVFSRAGDPVDLRRHLQELVDCPDRRRRVGAAARRLFLEDLHEQRMLEETLRVYRKEAGQRTL